MAPNRKPKPRKAKAPLSQNPALVGSPAVAESLKRPEEEPKTQAEAPVESQAETKPEAETTVSAVESEPEPKTESRTKPKKRLSVGKRVALGVVVTLLVIAIGAFSWDRWLRYDDAADMQGEWLIEGTETTIQIDEGQIHLTDADAYAYQVDPTAKCLTLSFGDLSGEARYRFSADRMRLSLADGSYSAFGTYFQDLPWMISSVFSWMIGEDPASPSMGEGSITLVRPEAVQGAAEDAASEAPATEMTEEQAAAADEAIEQSGSSEVGSNAVSVEDLL